MRVKLNGLKLSAISAALPNKKLKMENLYERFGQREVERIALSTGISSLRIAEEGVNASDLCLAATKHLLEMTGLSNKTIDAIIFVSQTPDYKMPATSCVLQGKLELNTSAVAFDINYGCSGYIYGLYQAALLISSKSASRVLVCVGDTISRFLDPNDHKVRLVLGDAGSVSIVESGSDEWAFDINTDGSGFDKLIIPRENHKDGYLQMDGSAIMEFALREVGTSFDNVINDRGWNKADIQHAILHQPNEFMLNYLRKKIGLSHEQMPVVVKEYGNTGPASIPLTMCDYYSNTAELGKAVMSGFGVGLSWGSIALNLCETKLYKPIFI
ncbi:3-oxoacyl-ACP synthase III family protein [Legionella spiritensis]|uniref:3-oxoacyl-ACP synthase n=1 Tax=Legionella spiritensis TaxID=452 RepID=A0A0W0YYX8_LEGSP|nr:ketoacyl-ACP synthase III [Legionella spiritensis]KTD62106.1 3-oxoacyl-ACP synthase [Legionella spiritensis]SNV34231.1 3-oxoacyl-(acyl-carrier-protein) [Legionella spiritensis]